MKHIDGKKWWMKCHYPLKKLWSDAKSQGGASSISGNDILYLDMAGSRSDNHRRFGGN